MFKIGLKIVNRMLAKFSKGLSSRQTRFQNKDRYRINKRVHSLL